MINLLFIQQKEKLRYNRPISFYGRKENLRLGEDVLRAFKKKFPYLKSNTFIEAKIEQNTNNPKFTTLLKSLNKLAIVYGENVLKNMKKLADFYPRTRKLQNTKNFVNKLEELLLENNSINCYEPSEIIKLDLLRKKEKPKLIYLKAREKYTKEIKQHTFLIFGLKKEAKINNPKTWGQNAVVVDSWSNLVLPAKEALEYFENFFKFNSKTHKIRLKQVMYSRNGYPKLKEL